MKNSENISAVQSVSTSGNSIIALCKDGSIWRKSSHMSEEWKCINEGTHQQQTIVAINFADIDEEHTFVSVVKFIPESPDKIEFVETIKICKEDRQSFISQLNEKYSDYFLTKSKIQSL